MRDRKAVNKPVNREASGPDIVHGNPDAAGPQHEPATRGRRARTSRSRKTTRWRKITLRIAGPILVARDGEDTKIGEGRVPCEGGALRG